MNKKTSSVSRSFFFVSIAVILLFAQTSPAQTSDDSRDILQPFNYEGVELLPGRLHDQYHQVKDFYLELRDADILKGFRTRNGKRAPGDGIPGAYSEGALTFGQWLSAFSRMYKITDDSAIRTKTLYLMNEWGKTIDDDGFFGYSAPPHNPKHYIYDKMVGGLVDIYEYIGDERALKYLDKITTWAENNLNRSNPYALPTEWYTLSENLYRAYELTGDKRYYDFAKVWEYNDYWDIFAKNESPFQDILKKNPKHESYHAYSHVNALSSAAMAYKITGEKHYLDTIVNAYAFLRETQMFATGGLGPEESFVVPDGLPETLIGDRRGASNVDVRFHFETACGSWAGFKLSRYLMTFTGKARYGDWAERLIYNGVGAMVPMNDDGMIMYGSCYHFHGAQKSLFTTWFCCSGTFPIDVAEYHNQIYYHDDDSLYVNLFVPSRVNWKSSGGKVTLEQTTEFPEKDKVYFKVLSQKDMRFALKFRVPLWAKDGMTVEVNQKKIDVETVPGSWAKIERTWKPDDRVSLQFDLTPRSEPLPGYITPVAVMCGPVVMAQTTARQSDDWLANVDDLVIPADWVTIHGSVNVDPNRDLHTNQVFRPFYDIKTGEYYKMYFNRWGKKTVLPGQMKFEGDWSTEGLARVSNSPEDSFEADFDGSALVWEGLRYKDAGIAKVFIDGKEVAQVDQYGYTDVYVPRLDQREVPFRWSISDLPSGGHTIKVIVSSKKNPASSGNSINVQRLLAYP